MKQISNKKVVFFGCPLDSDERYEFIQEKLSCMDAGQEMDNPYPFIMEFIHK